MIPTYEKLQKYMTVEFIPYGNAHVRDFEISFPRSCCLMNITIWSKLIIFQYLISNFRMAIVGGLLANMDNLNAQETFSSPVYWNMFQIKMNSFMQFIVLRSLVQLHRKQILERYIIFSIYWIFDILIRIKFIMVDFRTEDIID